MSYLLGIERKMLGLAIVPLPEIQTTIANLFQRIHALEKFVTSITTDVILPLNIRFYLEVMQ